MLSFLIGCGAGGVQPAVSAQPVAKHNAWSVPEGMWIKTNNDIDCIQASNVALSNGVLHLIVRQESMSCPGGVDYGPQTQSYTTGHVYTTSFNFTYGHVDSRIRFTGLGAHSALWMMGTAGQATNPYSTAAFDSVGGVQKWCDVDNEIDIAETKPAVSGNTTTIFQNLCTGHAGSAFQIFTTPVSDYSQSFHTYGLDWAPGNLKFCVDGAQTNTTTASVPSSPMYLLASIEMDSGGSGGTNGSYPQSLDVDYIRVSPSTGGCSTIGEAQAAIFDEEFNEPGGLVSK